MSDSVDDLRHKAAVFAGYGWESISRRISNAADELERVTRERDEARAEADALKHDIERHIGIAIELTEEVERLRVELKETVRWWRMRWGLENSDD